MCSSDLEDLLAREPWVDLAAKYYKMNAWEDCYLASKKALSIKQQQQSHTSESYAWGFYPHDLLAISAYRLGLKEEALKQKKPIEKKKSVFAKFKSYNKEAGTGKVSTGAPPKNSIPNQKLEDKQANEKVLLKEKANRYTYEGKMANFSFLKKVSRKAVDKKYAMSFADFKKMQKDKK